MVLVLIASIFGVFVLSAPLLRRRLDIFEPLTYFIVAYVLGGLIETVRLVAGYGLTSFPFGITYESFITTQIYSLIGLVSLQIGYNSKLSTSLSLKIPKYKPSSIRFGRLWVSAVALYLVGLLFLYILLSSISFNLFDLFQISSKRQVSSGYIRWGSKLIGVSTVLGFALNIKERNSILSIKSLFVFISVLSYFLYCFVFSTRGQFLTIVIIYFIVYRYIHGKFKLLRFLSVASALSMLFGFMGVIRGPRRFLTGGFWSATFETITEKLFGLSSFYNITTFSLIVENVPDEFNYQWGSTLINWLLFPIPRSYWPEKPINLGQRIGAELYHQGIGKVGSGVPPPFVSELFLNFHLIGVVFGMFLFGAVSKSFHKYVIQNQSSLFSVVVYAIVARYIFVLFAGDLTKTMVGMLKWLVPIAIVFIICSGFRVPTTQN